MMTPFRFTTPQITQVVHRVLLRWVSATSQSRTQEIHLRFSSFRESTKYKFDPGLTALFRFSSCYGQDSTQEEIFRNDVEPLIDVVYSGVVRVKRVLTAAIYSLCLLDGHYFRIWRHIFRKNTYHAGHQNRPRSYTPCCSGIFRVISSWSSCQPISPGHVREKGPTSSIPNIAGRIVYGNI